MAERRLSIADAAWLYSEWDRNPQTVSSLMWLDREIDPAVFRAVVQERLVDKYPTFHQRIRESRNPLLMPHWEDDPDFDLDRHVEVLQLPAPHDRTALESLVSQQRSTLLEPGRPLWKFFVIQGYEQEGVGPSTVLHARIQHAIADGWALVRLVLSLADEDSDAEQVKVVDRPKRGKRQSAVRALQPAVDAVESVAAAVTGAAGAVKGGAAWAAGQVAGLVRDPQSVPARLASGQDLVEGALTMRPDPARFVEFGSALGGQVASGVQPVSGKVDVAATGAKDAVDFLLAPRPGKTILHGEVSGTKKVSWIDPIPLEPVKEAGKTLGVTINSMLMGAQTEALRRYLLEKDALTAEELYTVVPVSLRKPTAPLPRKLGNRFGLVPILLPVGLADPVEQARSIQRQMDELRSGQMPVVSFGLTSALVLATPDVQRLVHKITQSQSIGVTTNVPGPRKPLKVAGGTVLGAWGMGGLSGNMNLSFGIFSLSGKINFSIHSDTAITPDPERILVHFVAAIDELVRRAAELAQPAGAPA
jgi:hypothetical protein